MAVGRSLVPEITYRALNDWDESINAAVSANLMRDPMRPSVRLNSWSDHYEGWSNGPRWQHIPPLFAYVPLPFFWIEGKPTIEMKRLSYFLLSALTGLLFIGMIQKARPRELESISAAAMAAGLWMLSPFTQGLVTGREFGTSDLVLAAAMVGAFAEILTLRQMRDEGRIPSGSHLVRAALVCSIPWVVKSWLGSIPLAHLAWLTWSWKDLPRSSKTRCLLAALLLPFLHTVWMVSISPETFLAEIGDPFKHFVDNEGWGRPWYFHFVYLHRNYLGNAPGLTVLFASGFLVASRVAWILRQTGTPERLLELSGSWFAFNLLVVSFIRSKSPNFLFQSFLLALFFILYGIALAIPSIGRFRGGRRLWPDALNRWIIGSLAVILVLLGRAWSREFQLARLSRVSPASPRSALFEVAERFRDQGWDTRDLLILDTDGDSEWQTYGFLFVSGVETRTLGQLRDFAAKRPDFEAFARQRYRRIGTLHQIRGYSLSACPVPLKLPDCLF